MHWKSRRRDSHSRLCNYRPCACPLCAWETPPRLQARGDQKTGEQLLASHMTSSHRHHALQLNKEHILFAWLELKKQSTAFLSCVITVDDQVFVFVMNYDLKRRKLFVVLKHVGSLVADRKSANTIPLRQRSKTPPNQTSNDCELATESEEHQPGYHDPQELRDDPQGLRDDPQELRGHENCDDTANKEDSFEHESLFRGQQDYEYCYLVEIMDSKCIQSVRLFQTALNKEDALDLAVKSGRCLSIDSALIDRLLEPGNGQFTVKITISRNQTNVEDSLKKIVNQPNVSEASAIT